MKASGHRCDLYALPLSDSTRSTATSFGEPGHRTRRSRRLELGVGQPGVVVDDGEDVAGADLRVVPSGISRRGARVAFRFTLKRLARRHGLLVEEIGVIDAQLEEIVRATTPLASLGLSVGVADRGC